MYITPPPPPPLLPPRSVTYGNYIVFPQSKNSENTNHRHLALTGTDHCNSRLS